MPMSANRPPRPDRSTDHAPRWRRAAGFVAALALALTGTVAGPGPAHAATDCLTVRSQASTWSTGTGTGGVSRSMTITNTCDTAVSGWVLALTMPTGHSFQHGWSATWTVTGSRVEATPAAWNGTVSAGGTVTIGYIGSWTGSPQEPGCTINGRPCGDPPGNPGPRVSLTSPTDGGLVVAACPVRFSAEASAGAGAVDRVEFYVDDQLVGADDSLPYEIDVPADHPAFRGASSPHHTAFARVLTTGPAAIADSPAIRFSRAPQPPALMVIACPSAVRVPEGGSTTLTFVTVCADTPGLNLTVTGDAGVSVTPTSSPGGTREHRVTVTAAPGSAGAVARIRADAEPGGCLPGTATVTVVPAGG